MHAMKVAIVFGVLCLAATASAQTSTAADLVNSNLDTGFYVVNGTGVQYDENTINLLVDGVVVQTLPRNAAAPGPSKGKPLFPPKPDHDDDHEDDHDLGFDHGKDQPPTLAPSPDATPDDEKNFYKTLDNKPEKPDLLNSIVIGRKLRL